MCIFHSTWFSTNLELLVRLRRHYDGHLPALHEMRNEGVVHAEGIFQSKVGVLGVVEALLGRHL